MPLYRYAFDSDEKLVDVLGLPAEREDKGTFVCISCGQPLVAKTAARKRVKHFAHKTTQPGCNFETYLHKLAKEAFHETFLLCRSEGRPYNAELFHSVRCVVLPASNCPNWEVLSYEDLTTKYDTAKLECRDGQFVPDLLLTDSTGVYPKLYVEILVKHPVTEAKVASGAAVIEIRVEGEACVEKIRGASLPSRMLNVFNFVLAPIEDRQMSCECDRRPVARPPRMSEARERMTAPAIPLPMSPAEPPGMKFDEASVSAAVRGTQYCISFSVGTNGVPCLQVGFRSDLERAQEESSAKVAYCRIERCSDLPMHGPWRMPLTCVMELEKAGIKPRRHCFLCRNVQTERQIHKSGHVIFLRCAVYGKTCGEQTAVQCSSFKALSKKDSQVSMSLG